MDRSEILSRLDEEIRIRPSRVGSVDLIELQGLNSPVWPAVPGTLLVAWSSNTVYLDGLKSLVEAGRVSELAASLNQTPVVLESAIRTTGDVLDHVPAIGELAYGGRSLITGATTPPWVSPSTDRVVLAFAGGTLQLERFTTRSFVLPGEAPLSFLVVVCPARPDPAEARILAALDANEVGLGVQPMNTLVVGAIAGAVATAVVGHYTDKATDRVDRDVKHWANNREREQQQEAREAEAQWRAKQAAERIRYRNGALRPGHEVVKGVTEPPRTLEGLLAARLEMLSDLRREASTGDR